MEATYLSDIELTDETLQHYGVKGMKWKYHKPKVSSNASAAYKQIGSMTDEEYNRILSKIKLTKNSKGGKSSTAKEKTSKGSSSEKKESSGKGSSAEKKESTKSEKTSTEKQTTTNERVVYKKQVDPEYTKYLENKLAKQNQSKLDTDQVKERIAVSDAKKKRLSMGIRKLYSRRG